jgi:chemotaxis protein MotB
LRPKMPRHSQLADGPVENWQMIYCSFALILVVFFVMMVSYSIVSGKGMKAVRKHFSRGSSLHAPGSSMQPLSGIPSEEAGEAPALLIQSATARFGLGNTVRVRMNSDGIDVVMKDNVLFAEGAVDVQKRIYPYLNVVGDVAARNGLHVQVKARATGLPGGEPADRSPWALSSQRAVNVMRYFLAYGRLSTDQVSAAGSAVPWTGKPNPDEGNGIELHLSVNQ